MVGIKGNNFDRSPPSPPCIGAELLLSLETFPWVSHQALGQYDVTLDCVLRIRENTGEVGTAKGGTQLLQHQGLPQLGAGAPALPAGAEEERL